MFSTGGHYFPHLFLRLQWYNDFAGLILNYLCLIEEYQATILPQLCTIKNQ
jgi:hypothetical protein